MTKQHDKEAVEKMLEATLSRLQEGHITEWQACNFEEAIRYAARGAYHGARQLASLVVADDVAPYPFPHEPEVKGTDLSSTDLPALRRQLDLLRILPVQEEIIFR